MKIYTERLVSIPLTKYQLETFTYKKRAFVEYFKLANLDYELSPELMEAIEVEFLPMISDDEYYYYETIWIIINKMTNKYIGSFCFKGMPNEFGEIEVGYGIDSKFRNQGYITEMLLAIIDFCKTEPNVKTIFAETDINNLPSIKVLGKAGFTNIVTKETGDIIFAYHIS
jgi:[ribosomal protein S5]-alanine N-acetyltransferase